MSSEITIIYLHCRNCCIFGRIPHFYPLLTSPSSCLYDAFCDGDVYFALETETYFCSGASFSQVLEFYASSLTPWYENEYYQRLLVNARNSFYHLQLPPAILYYSTTDYNLLLTRASMRVASAYVACLKSIFAGKCRSLQVQTVAANFIKAGFSFARK